MPSSALLVGGKIPDAIMRDAEKRGICTVDYFKSEAFQIKNAYTTAEAAVSVAMNNMKKNLRSSHFAITGYGRIARALADLLIAFGASVTVLARNIKLCYLGTCFVARVCNGKTHTRGCDFDITV